MPRAAAGLTAVAPLVLRQPLALPSGRMRSTPAAQSADERRWREFAECSDCAARRLDPGKFASARRRRCQASLESKTAAMRPGRRAATPIDTRVDAPHVVSAAAAAPVANADAAGVEIVNGPPLPPPIAGETPPESQQAAVAIVQQVRPPGRADWPIICGVNSLRSTIAKRN